MKPLSEYGFLVLKGQLTEFYLVGVEFWWHFAWFTNKFRKKKGPVKPMIVDSENTSPIVNKWRFAKNFDAVDTGRCKERNGNWHL